ncbi:uncharacterized protein EDB91DRAFT_1166366 [Suillus paluster]|uniref:uncharacterized protein n=1 Tax=Suillus paluster TaxID=48578 RepID=UPI001B86459A|nr:uncharacterized protein EDB91DRAFT_1166366 [Suillus paluster]KAG1726359.1 hypothetical protein EDB91DRAFT_1166366 [Suillus paluster]
MVTTPNMSSKPKQTMYNTRSCTRARASSVSTPAHEKNVKVHDDFGNLIVNLLSSVKTPAEGPRSPGQSYETENEIQPTLRPIRSYSDVVRAEIRLAASTLVEIPTAENIPALGSPANPRTMMIVLGRPLQENATERRSSMTVNQRKYSVRHDHGNDTEPPGEGPSKGKGPDPWNWGEMTLEEEELDMEAQHAALESYKLAKRMAGTNLAIPEGVKGATTIKLPERKRQ